LLPPEGLLGSHASLCLYRQLAEFAGAVAVLAGVTVLADLFTWVNINRWYKLILVSFGIEMTDSLERESSPYCRYRFKKF